MSDAMKILKGLGAKFSPDFDAYASGEITVSQIQCLLCGKAPCVPAVPEMRLAWGTRALPSVWLTRGSGAAGTAGCARTA